jgi:hypothetical protein
MKVSSEVSRGFASADVEFIDRRDVLGFEVTDVLACRRESRQNCSNLDACSVLGRSHSVNWCGAFPVLH